MRPLTPRRSAPPLRQLQICSLLPFLFLFLLFVFFFPFLFAFLFFVAKNAPGRK
jgi:hypothetical protein